MSGLQYTLDQLNTAVLTIKTYSLFTTVLAAEAENAYIHGITQEFIRLQMQEDHEYQAYYEKTIQILAGLMPDRITNASARNLVNRILKHAVKLLSHKADSSGKSVQDRLLFAGNTATKLYILGYYRQTIEFTQEQLDTYHSFGQNSDLLQMVIFLAQAWHYTGEDNNALCVLEKYCSIVSSSEELTDTERYFLLSRYKNAEGIIQKDQGKYELCLTSYLEALKYNEYIDQDLDKDTRCNILNNIGIVYRHLGQYEDALKYYNQALSCSNGEKHLLLRIYGNIATAYKALNRYDAALSNYKYCHDYSVELGDMRNECTCLGNLGDCYIELRQYKEAADSINKALELAEKMQFMIGIINAQYNLGRLAFYQKEYAEAKEHWEKSLEISRSANYQAGSSLAINALTALRSYYPYE